MFQSGNQGGLCHWLASVAQSCPTLRDPMDCSPPGSSVHGIIQARILEQEVVPFSRLLVRGINKKFGINKRKENYTKMYTAIFMHLYKTACEKNLLLCAKKSHVCSPPSFILLTSCWLSSPTFFTLPLGSYNSDKKSKKIPNKK